MTTQAQAKTRFLEGGNLAAAAVIPVAYALALLFYPWVAQQIKPLHIEIVDVYLYVFSLFAIEFGALIALFALFACRPTPFLERMKSTATFSGIIANTRATIFIATFAIAITFILGILRTHPDADLTLNSVIFVTWCAVAAATTAFYIRTVRLIFLALT